MSHGLKIAGPDILGLEELLLRLGWTGQDLMVHIDVDKNTVTNWRKGHHRVPKVVLLYLNLLVRTYEGLGANARPGASHAAPGGRENF